MPLRKLEALLETAGKATARPWQKRDAFQMIWNSNHLFVADCGGIKVDIASSNAAFIVEAANAAEDMARLLIEAYEALETACDTHDCNDACPMRPATCPDWVRRQIEQRFGGEDALSL